MATVSRQSNATNDGWRHAFQLLNDGIRLIYGNESNAIIKVNARLLIMKNNNNMKSYDQKLNDTDIELMIKLL